MTPAANVFKMSEGYISGTIRYEVLKSANLRANFVEYRLISRYSK
jgi:hypothetical protein